MSQSQSPAKTAVAVMTFKSVETLARDGGTQSWRMNARHIGTFDYAIVCRCTTAYTPQDDRPHRMAFVLGKISDVVPSTEPHHNPPRDGKRRWLFRFSEMAVIGIEEFWRFGRWPTVIRSLDEFGIDPSQHDFKPVSWYCDKDPRGLYKEHALDVRAELLQQDTVEASGSVGEVIAAHKASLARALGVKQDWIDISVRF